MALGTDTISIGFQLQTVRLVAVTAGNTFMIHPALEKRSVLINLALDLSVGMV
jgi:hypothetical protein